MLINRGIPVDRVAAATHTEIHPIHIRAEANAPRTAHLERDGHSLSVFRPALPAPRPSNNPRLVGEGVPSNPHFDLHSRVERTAAPQRNPVVNSGAERRPIISNGYERQNQVIPRAPGTTSFGNGNSAQSEPSYLRHGPEFQPQTPAQSTRENNGRDFTAPRQQPMEPMQPTPRQPISPSFNRPGNEFRGNAAELQQRQFQQPQTVAPTPRQQIPSRNFEAPREAPRETPRNQENFNSGFRSEPVAPPQRSVEPRPAPEVHSAPQYSAPAHQESGGGRNSGGGGGGGNNGNGNNNGNGGGGGGGRNR
jgi:uncharacterized membrane protein YgcG